MSAGSRGLGTTVLIVTAALWGSNHVVARAARDVVPLPALVFWRWALGVLVLTVIAVPSLQRSWPAVRSRLFGLIIGGIVGVGLFSYFLLGGAYQSLALEVGFINATTPVWVVVFGLWMGDARRGDAGMSFGVIAGLALAFAGTLLIICKGELEALTAFRFSLGNLWSLLAAISFAWFSIRVRDWARTIEPLPLTVITGWAGVVFVMLPVYLVWIATGGPWLTWNVGETRFAVAAIGYIGLAPTMLGNLFYLYGVATNGPTRAAAFLYLSPLFSAGFSIVWLGEQLAWYHVLGIATISAGLILLNRFGPKPMQTRSEPA